MKRSAMKRKCIYGNVQYKKFKDEEFIFTYSISTYVTLGKESRGKERKYMNKVFD